MLHVVVILRQKSDPRGCFEIGANISIDYLSHRYSARSHNVIQAIDFSIAPGEQIAIIGRSGCGKSTLLHLMAGLIKPTDGAVRMDSKTVHRPSSKWNVMFQKASLFPWMSVVENAALGLVYSGVPRKRAHALVNPLIEMLGLKDKIDTNVQSLSGGQQQRVALARSLATEPDALFLDEPFSALDTFSRSALQQEVSQICRDKKITMVLVTHDVDEAALMADRVLIMSEGPGQVDCEFSIDIPWPRELEHVGFQTIRHQLMRQFEQSALRMTEVQLDEQGMQSLIATL